MIFDRFRGQSAIEYLMTYGWMLLVVAVVGGAIFATVNQDSPSSVTGFTGSNVQVDDFGVTRDDDLQLELRSSTGQGATVSAINVTDESNGKYVYREFSSNNSLDVGESLIFDLPNVSQEDSSNNLDVEIFYDTGGLSNLTVSGSITGSLEVTETVDDSSGSNNDAGGAPTTIVYRTEGDYSARDYSSMSYNNPVGNSEVDLIRNGTAAGNVIQEDVSSYDKAVIQYLDSAGGDGPDNGAEGYGGRVKDLVIDLSSKSTLYLWVAGGSDQTQGRYDGTASSSSGAGSTEISLSNTDSSDSNQEPFLAAAGGGSGETGAGEYGGGARNGTGEEVFAGTNYAEGSAPPSGGDGGGDGGAAVDAFAGNMDNSTISRTSLLTKGSNFAIIKGGGSQGLVDGEIRIKYE